jgi:hypothetical protein
MIKTTKQNWQAGSTVKVGFLSLVVIQAVATPGDYLPDAYLLTNAAHTKLYRFVPHNGLQSISMDEANEMIAESAALAARVAAKAIAKASSTREIDALFA